MDQWSGKEQFNSTKNFVAIGLAPSSSHVKLILFRPAFTQRHMHEATDLYFYMDHIELLQT